MNALALNLSLRSDGSVHILSNLGSPPVEHTVPAITAELFQERMAALMTTADGMSSEILVQIGAELREVFLKPIYDELLNTLQSDEGRLHITCDRPEYLRLPWEFLPMPDGPFLASGNRWTLIRSDRQSLLPERACLASLPLRIVFCACAPTDLAPFDFEAEEEAVIRLAHQLGASVHVEIAESGTIEEVCQMIARYKPQIVHLAGHSTLSGRMGSFAFENERGLSNWCPSTVMADRLLADKGVGMLLLTGNRSSRMGAATLGHLLTATEHVPAAMAWPTHMADERSLKFLSRFLSELVEGRSVEFSLTAAGRELAPRVAVGREAAPFDNRFTPPLVYAVREELSLADRSRPQDAPGRPGVHYELLGDSICGLAEGFVGRRRVIQRIFPAFRAGQKHLLFLTGMSGSGRSTMAARIATLGQEEGYQIAAVQARLTDTLPFHLRVLGRLAQACGRLGQEEDKRLLSDGQRTVSDRLSAAVEILNRSKILLVIDNLEELLAMTPASPAWRDAEFAGFFQHLTARMNGKGRVILTCNQIPKSVDLNQPNIAHESLPAFTVVDFLKYIWRYPEVTDRIHRGKLSREVVESFYRKLGITPRFVKQACAVLTTVDTSKMQELLSRVPEGLSPAEQQASFIDVFLPELFNSMTAEYRLGLSRLALVEVPLPLDGVARVSGLARTQADRATKDWFAAGLILQFCGEGLAPLHTVHPLERAFFTHSDRLSSDHSKAGHLAASAFFQDTFELNREEEFRLSVTTGLLACFQHAMAAGSRDMSHWAAVRLSRRLPSTAGYQASRELIDRILREANG